MDVYLNRAHLSYAQIKAVDGEAAGNVGNGNAANAVNTVGNTTSSESLSSVGIVNSVQPNTLTPQENGMTVSASIATTQQGGGIGTKEKLRPQSPKASNSSDATPPPLSHVPHRAKSANDGTISGNQIFPYI